LLLHRTFYNNHFIVVLAGVVDWWVGLARRRNHITKKALLCVHNCLLFTPHAAPEVQLCIISAKSAAQEQRSTFGWARALRFGFGACPASLVFCPEACPEESAKFYFPDIHFPKNSYFRTQCPAKCPKKNPC
jgi:hypothetical protein